MVDARRFAYKELVDKHLRSRVRLLRECPTSCCVNPEHYTPVKVVVRIGRVLLDTARVRDFWNFVRQHGRCLVFTGTHDRHGYGKFLCGKKILPAHHVAYLLETGKLPPARKHLHHKCNRRDCVRFIHLRALTPRQHVHATPSGIGYKNARKTHCLHGHPLSGENLVLSKTKRGGLRRECRKCVRECHNRQRRNNIEQRRAYARAYYHAHVKPKRWKK
jgi:hypothetical protein